MTNPDERSLIDQARRDPQAFGPLYERYVDLIYAFVYRRTGDRHLTEDITAATFEAALRNLKNFQWQDKGFAVWLYRIARNKLIQHYRRQRYLAPFKLFAANQRKVDTRPQFIDQIETNDTLSTALSQLSYKDQEIIGLRFFEDLSTAEVAAILDCSKENVYLRLHRALRRLREHIEVLDQEGVEAYG